MKKPLLVLFTLLAGVVAFAQEGQGNRAEPHKSTKTILAEVKTGKAYLIDVRTPEEYDEGHLKFSRNIDFKSADFKRHMGRLDKQRPVYLYCRSGNRSGKATDSLQVWGFGEVRNLGGFTDLHAAGLPAEK